MAERSRMAAAAVWDFLAPGYGPHGGHRLLDLQDGVQLLKSPASGLNEQALDAVFAPFQQVARSVRSAVGDQATAATLLAAGLVRRAFDAEDAGLPRPVLLDGLRMAARQALASLRAMVRTEQDAGTALAHVTALGQDAVKTTLAGLRSLAEDRGQLVPLDDVDILVEPVDRPEWAEGTLARPQHCPDLSGRSDVGVLVVDGGWRMTPRASGVQRIIRAPTMLTSSLAEEAAMRNVVLDRLQDLGVGLVVCGGSVDDGLCQAARRRGIWVWTDAPKDTRRRLAASTGATSVPDLDHVEGAAVGRADIRRRPHRRGGWWVNGPAASATLVLPSHLSVMQASVADDGERLLRAAGVMLAAPTSVPGGGRWQRQVAAALRTASVHAPGKNGLVVELAAEVLDAMADLLVQHGGHDPLDERLLPDADDVLDAAPCVLAAVQAGFDAAITLLRVDGRYDKRPSTPEGLRGGHGPIGSPKGMPGDVPPLM